MSDNQDKLDNIIFEMIPPNLENVLHVNCGSSQLATRLREEKQVRRVIGVDPDPGIATKACKSLARVWTGDLSKLKVNNYVRAFDCLILPQTINTIENPWDFVNTYGQYLKPGGILISSFWNANHIGLIKNLLFGKVPYGSSFDKNMIRLFTLEEATKLFFALNFKPIRVADIKSATEDDKDYIRRLSKAVEVAEEFPQDATVAIFVTKWQKQ